MFPLQVTGKEQQEFYSSHVAGCSRCSGVTTSILREAPRRVRSEVNSMKVNSRNGMRSLGGATLSHLCPLSVLREEHSPRGAPIATYEKVRLLSEGVGEERKSKEVTEDTQGIHLLVRKSTTMQDKLGNAKAYA